jgi:histidyl-tRNA synthetase
VRGLDYYTRTTFEVVSGELGSQNSVLGGGRYDGLVKDLGGPDLCGIGFALGMERLVMLLKEPAPAGRCDVFLAPLTAAGLDKALLLQKALRQSGVAVLMDSEGRSFKSQMKRADKLGARFVAMLGENEIRKGVWTLRDMAGSSQEEVRDEALAQHLREKLHG